MTGRVLLLASPGIGPARAAWRLLERGFTLAGCWCGRGILPAEWRRDAALGRRNAAFSLTAALAAAGIARQEVPPLSRWPAWPGAFDGAAPDLVVSAHFHWRVPIALLRRLPGQVVNLHPTLLPQYRGPSGHAALLADGAGAWAAGVTLHLMDAEFDRGAILAQRPVPFHPGADAIDWELDTARAYATLIDEGLLPYLAGRLAPRPQAPGSGSYASITGAALNLDGRVPLERARRIVEIFGQWRSIVLRSAAGTWRVRPPLTALGPATGAPPRRRLLRLEADLADARVSLRRAITGHGRRLRRRRRRRFSAARP